ncbi:hypothetical protein ACFWNE_37120 [Streptomyces goshikiensis]|uniref:hypothetical protein n=1 Tax=Streptomyces goshikiensis TaxID=1942 RepID=UPI00364EC019
MAILFCMVCASLTGVIAFSLARHLGAEPLVSLGWAGGTFIGAYYLVQNILEKFGQL